MIARLARMVAFLSALTLLAITWLRETPPPPNHDLALTILPVPLPEQRKLGPFSVTGAWQLTSPNDDFGGYSALLRGSPGRLLAFSDRGMTLEFAAPGSPPGPVLIGPVAPITSPYKRNRDVESVAWDGHSNFAWLALEGRATIMRGMPGMEPEVVRIVPEWAEWDVNTGPEAMARLHDGRFVVLCECRSGWFDSINHPGFLYAGDPAEGVKGQPFTFAGADGYRPTDMAELPDGRVLVVMRKLLWPAPARFAGKIMLADPAGLVPGKVWDSIELADLASPWPVDNFEALAIEPLPGGRIAAWLMSDENEAVSQRVLLWRLEFRLSDLPARNQAKQKAPG